MYAWYNTPHNSLILELMFLRLNLVIRLIADPSLFSIYRETLTELYKPLEDPLITRCIEIMEFDENHNTQRSGMLKNIWSKVFPKPRRCWLPTGCLVRKLFKLFFCFCSLFSLCIFQKYYNPLICRNCLRFYMMPYQRCL